MSYLNELVHREFCGDKTIRSVKHSEVTHFTACDKYVIAHHPGGEVLITDTLKYLLNEDTSFVRLHRGTIVKKELLSKMLAYSYERPHSVELTTGEVIKVSRRAVVAIRKICESNRSKDD